MDEKNTNNSLDLDKKEDALNEQIDMPKPRKSLFKKILKICSVLFVLGSVSAVAGAYFIIQWASKDLPSLSAVADFEPPLSTTILARDGSYVDEIFFEQRYLIDMGELPSYVPMAFICAEDKDFYTHLGISPIGILRAAIANITSGSNSQGGSTITQQVVKRLLLTPERTYTRKIKEMILAFQLEKQLDKDQILHIYLNQIHMGGQSYGIEAGARYYFAKNAKDLTVAEIALLAGILPATTRYNPYRNPEAARNRQVYVLGRMRADGVITDAQYEEAFYTKLEFASMAAQNKSDVGGWFLAEVRRQLVELFNEENSEKYGFNYGIYGEQAIQELGLTVYTTMEPEIQRAAEAALKRGLENSEKRRGWYGPITKIDSTDFDSYLAKASFKNADLENDKWVRALVTAVETQGATVALNSKQQGYISVATMGWARKPNKNIPGDEKSKNIKNATSVLNAGDVVYVRFNPATGNGTEVDTKELLLGEVTSETIIPLALEILPRVEGALIALEPKTADVVALVGGYSFGVGDESNFFNRATQAFRQPGSAFKPVVYSSALDKGYTLASEVLDAPILLKDPVTKEMWRPTNFDASFSGYMNFRSALALSRNLSTIRIAQEVGMYTIISRAKDLGFDGEISPTLAASLGAIDVTPISVARAYTAFANSGMVSEPRLIHKIEGPWGNVIYETEAQHTRAISAQNAYLVADMLKMAVQGGTATASRGLNIASLAAKTGTTNEEMDAWFVAFTPNLVTTTYVGFDLPEPMGRSETGTNTAQPIFIDFARKVYSLYPRTAFPEPRGISWATVDGRRLPFASGTSPTNSKHINASKAKAKTQASDDLLKQIF